MSGSEFTRLNNIALVPVKGRVGFASGLVIHSMHWTMATIVILCWAFYFTFTRLLWVWVPQSLYWSCFEILPTYCSLSDWFWFGKFPFSHGLPGDFLKFFSVLAAKSLWPVSISFQFPITIFHICIYTFVRCNNLLVCPGVPRNPLAPCMLSGR